MSYIPADDRYNSMVYRRCGNSGLQLPAVSLGLWHTFGHDISYQTQSSICRTAFDQGITHLDLANNYGLPAGSAEEVFGKILSSDFHGYRDELIISSKEGCRMWPGPYGKMGGRKYLMPPVIKILSAWVWIMSMFFIRIALIPIRRWKKPWER